jgi:hypothetical protein
VRPFGSPERRLRLFVSILRDRSVSGLPEKLEQAYLGHRLDPGPLQKELSRLMTRAGLPGGSALLSVANLVLPYLCVRMPNEKKWILGAFRRLKGAEKNSRIDRFSDWPVPADLRGSEVFQQGILGLYERYCSGHCPDCPLFPAAGGALARVLGPRPGISPLWKKTA